VNEKTSKEAKITRLTKALKSTRGFRYFRLLSLSSLTIILLSHCSALGQTQSLLDDGVKLIAEGKFPEALRALNQHKQNSLSDARAYLYAGIAYAELGYLNAAAMELDEAVRLDPKKMESAVLQANVYSRLKQNEAARDALGKVQTPSTLETAWLWLLCDSYFRLEQLDQTLKVLELISTRTPRDGRVELLRGQVMALNGAPEAALTAFKQSAEKSPALAAAHFEAGKIHYQRDEMTAAQKFFLEAVRLDAKQTEALLKLGQVYLALGQTGEAIETLTRVEREAPSLAQTYYSLGVAYSRRGDRAKSAAYRQKFQEITREQKAKEQRDQQFSRLIAQGEDQLDQGNDGAAREFFLQASTLDPNSWDARGYLVELYLASSDWRLARPHLVRMEEIDAESAVGNFLMARYLYQNREYQKALDYAEKVRLVRPAHAELRNLIGGLHVALGQPDKAALEFETAVRLAPDRADYLENLRKVKKPE
jgi:tetratricopeptide (TPR) repeat protein